MFQKVMASKHLRLRDSRLVTQSEVYATTVNLEWLS